MSRRGEWSIEVRLGENWHRLFEQDRGFCLGWLAHHRESGGPRCAMRAVKPDGSVHSEVATLTEVGIGMVAGHPTAEQYERAGLRALERARLIREREARDEARRAGARDPDAGPKREGWPPGYQHTVEHGGAWTGHGWVTAGASRSARGFTSADAARASAWLDAELGTDASA